MSLLSCIPVFIIIVLIGSHFCLSSLLLLFMCLFIQEQFCKYFYATSFKGGGVEVVGFARLSDPKIMKLNFQCFLKKKKLKRNEMSRKRERE